MVDLAVSRQEIDKIDKQIVELFERRMKVAQDVAEYKRSIGKAVYDRERELQKLATVKSYASNDFNAHAVEEIFVQLMSISRRYQHKLNSGESAPDFEEIKALPKGADTRVVFFGATGSYSEQAMEECFGTEITRFPAATFREVMAAVKEGRADYGVLPIENTTTGGITDCYDLLVEFDHYIVGEHVLKINQALLGLPEAELADIRQVYSHPQGILQSRKFLEQYPAMQAIESGSTAGSAQKVAEEKDKSQAAIASVRAAQTYGLKVLAENINYEDCNSTRFIVITSKKQYFEDAGKVSICFSLPHETGTLYNMLSNIIYNDLNMTKIESRPLEGKTFEYRFFVDFEGNLKEAGVKNTLNGIAAEALEMKILGNYKSL
ncbi:MAG: prephenate dehydratase [Lachnospiraceae bacterium]|nr:prephenate dehydratase [Lachnospiraceae bacterium]